MNSLIDSILLEIGRFSEQYSDSSYLVGGAVRDSLLNRPLKDFDFAVQNNPKQLAEHISKKFNSPLVFMTDKFEIYRTILSDGTQIDFTKLKGSTIEEDLSNRDFTINAMAIQIHSSLTSSQLKEPQSILDPYGGKIDLERKVVREISDQIYSEDPLRLLRAFRIATQIQFSIKPSTLKSIFSQAPKIVRSAAERIREEILLILECSNSDSTIRQMDSLSLLSQLFPEIEENRRCALDYYPGKGVWGHSLDALSNLEWIFQNLEKEFPEDFIKLKELFFQKGSESEGHSRAALLKLGTLFHDLGKAATAKMIEGRLRFFDHPVVGARMARGIAERFKFSTHATQYLSSMVYSHMRPGGLAFTEKLTDKAKFRFFRDLGVSAIPTLVLSLADRYTYLSLEERGKGLDVHEKLVKEFIRWHYQKEIEQLAKKPKLVDGNRVMQELGLPPGPLIGKILLEIEEATVLEEIHTVEEALHLARKIASKNVV